MFRSIHLYNFWSEFSNKGYYKRAAGLVANNISLNLAFKQVGLIPDQILVTN